MESWHRLSPSYLMLVVLSRKPKNQGVKTLLAARVFERSRHLFGFPDTGARRHKQEADVPNSFKGRRLNAQVQEKQRGDSGGRLFCRVKKQAHYPTASHGPKLLAWPLKHLFSSQNKGNRRETGGRRF